VKLFYSAKVNYIHRGLTNNQKSRTNKTVLFCSWRMHKASKQIQLFAEANNKTDLSTSCAIRVTVSRTRTVYGSRAFSVAAPTSWNSLPADISNAASL